MGSPVNGILAHYSATVIALDNGWMLPCSDRKAAFRVFAASLTLFLCSIRFSARIRRDGIPRQSGDFAELSLLTDHFKEGDLCRFCHKTGGFVFESLHVRHATMFLQIVHAFPVLVKHEQ